jgi:STE24 endopeptidase
MIWNGSSLLVVGLLSLMYGVGLVISLLNLSYQNRPLPKNVSGIFTPDQLKKSKAYFKENTLFSLVTSTFNYILMIALFQSGFFPWIQQFVSGLTTNTLLQTFLFFSILIVLNTLMNAPFGFYDTFSIESRYGFNKSTKKLFFSDLIRNVILSTVLLATIGVILHAIYQGLGDNFVIVAWLVLAVLQVTLFMLNTKVFVKIFNKLTPIPEGSLKTSIVDLAKRTGFRAKAIYSMDASKRSSKLNAFFSGFGPIREIALFDTLLNKLSEREILSVLAHEIGHAKHFDEIRLLLQSTLIFGVYAFIINLVASDVALAQAFGFTTPYFAFGLILFSILIGPLDFLLGLPLNALSRRAEYAADAFAVKQGFKKEMTSALKVLEKENFGNLTPHPVQVFLTYSHPPTTDRLAAIEALNV